MKRQLRDSGSVNSATDPAIASGHCRYISMHDAANRRSAGTLCGKLPSDCRTHPVGHSPQPWSLPAILPLQVRECLESTRKEHQKQPYSKDLILRVPNVHLTLASQALACEFGADGPGVYSHFHCLLAMSPCAIVLPFQLQFPNLWHRDNICEASSIVARTWLALKNSSHWFEKESPIKA